MRESVIGRLAEKPFVPHPALRNPHAQTILSSLIRRRTPLLSSRPVEPRAFDIAPGVRVVGYCSWQQKRTDSPTLILLHGLEGSSGSPYMLGTAEKALAAGFNVIRLNHRNCGGTDHLTASLYHAGLTTDVRQIISELIEVDRLDEIYVVGFSLGGNITLKLAGEYGLGAPVALRKVAVISPSLDLMSCADAIEMRSNLIYHMSFVRSLKSSLRRKARLYPDRYDAAGLRGVRTIREFDDLYTAPHAGFLDVTDYYQRASALPYVKNITLPTLILHSQDDPFIPFAPFESGDIQTNPNVILLAPRHGGHVGFLSSTPENGDRFWAESRVVEFFSF
jgi:uncharacterized protein